MSLRSFVKSAAKRVLRLRLFAPLIAFLFWRRLELLFESDQRDALSVLAFSSFRWKQDLQALAAATNVRIWAVDDNFVQLINSLFLPVGKQPNPHYFMEEDAEILASRERLIAYCGVVARTLKLLFRLDCAVTAAVHYNREHPWAAGFDASGLPFIAAHKEFTVIDDRHLPERIELAVQKRQKFLGTAVCVCNARAKQLFGGSGVAPEDKIHVTGLLRMDNLFKHGAAKRGTAEQSLLDNVTLFSFGHYAGGLGRTDGRSHYFSSHDQEGFVELFRDVHAAFAEAALRHPDLNFVFKTKPGDYWDAEIRNIVESELKRPFDSIANLKISDPLFPAPELIRRSRVVVGFNSTVLIEARVLGRPTIMPYFAEAREKYPYNVYFHEFHDMFATAHSKEELLDKLSSGIRSESIHDDDPARLSEFVTNYIAYDDGRSAERVYEVLCHYTRRQRRDIPVQRNSEMKPPARNLANFADQ